MTIDFANVIPKLDTYLARGLCAGMGTHGETGQICIEEALALALGEPLSDRPTCDAPAVRQYKIGLNDSCRWASPESRAAGLRAIGIASIGSKGVVDEDAFAARVYELTVREQIPAIFRLLLADEPTCLAAADRCEQEGTREAAIAARDAARAVARARGYTGPWYGYWSAEVAVASMAVASMAAAVAVAESAAAVAVAESAVVAAVVTAAEAPSSPLPAPESFLLRQADIGVRVLRELGSPGVAWLDAQKEG